MMVSAGKDGRQVKLRTQHTMICVAVASSVVSSRGTARKLACAIYLNKRRERFAL
jgi:hypothetical protein